MSDEFPLIIIELYQTWSILMLNVIFALHHVQLLLLVPDETEADLELQQTRCLVIQLAMNRSRRVSEFYFMEDFDTDSTFDYFFKIN